MRILTVNVPYAGHVNPTLPLTKELVKRGHQVTYINAEEFRSKIEASGAVFLPYADFPAGLTDGQKKRRCFQAAYNTAMALEEPHDLLIYEMFFYPGYEIARKKNIPAIRQFAQPAWSEETWKTAPPIFKVSAKLIDAQVMGKKKKAAMGLPGTEHMDREYRSNHRKIIMEGFFGAGLGLVISAVVGWIISFLC